jgi:hypothetical protein
MLLKYFKLFPKPHQTVVNDIENMILTSDHNPKIRLPCLYIIDKLCRKMDDGTNNNVCIYFFHTYMCIYFV